MIKSPNTILRLLRSKKVTSIKIEDLGGAGNFGFCYTERGTIHIGKHLQERARVSALIHECLHLLNPKIPTLTNKEEDDVMWAVEKRVLEKLSKKQYNEMSNYVV